MTWFLLILGGLATYRLALLVSKEDGPAYLLRRLRKMPDSKSARDGLQCEWCVSVWMALAVILWLWYIGYVSPVLAPLYWLAMSAIAIICHQQWTRK
jgi:hypothetical protein